MTTDFSAFGSNFQTRIIQGVITDHNFFESIYEVLKSDYFSAPTHQTVWNSIKSYYENYMGIPAIENIRVELASKKIPGVDSEALTALLWELEHKIDIKSIEQAKDKTFEFCKNRAMEEAILTSVDILKEDKNNKFDEINKTIEDALKISIQSEIGHKYFEDINERAVIQARRVVPTGIPTLDGENFLDGGLANGEIGVFMAPTGGGKSFWLVNLGYGALKNKKNVVHYTLELSEPNVGLRYDARICKLPIKEIKSNIKIVEKELNEFDGGKLIIKEFPTKTASVNTIKFHIGRLVSSGFDPDLIIIDYADLMKSRKGYDQKRFELESIYEELRGLAMEYKFPIWTATQVNREGFNQEIITLDKMGESIAKAQIADFIASFSRTLEDRKSDSGKLFIAKNRIGLDGVLLPVNINTATSYIGVGSESGDTSDLMDIEGKTTRESLKKAYDRARAKEGL